MIDKYKQPYLQPYTGRDSRKTCPKCKRGHSFTLYLDGETGQPIHPTVGICNHTNSCGYHYAPKQYYIDNPHKRDFKGYSPMPMATIVQAQPMVTAQPQPMGLIPIEYVNRSIGKESDFVQFLENMFNNIPIDEVCNNYKLGATRNRNVIFWQIDIHGNVRTGKIMRYDPTTGKRVHDESGAIDWVHNKLKRAGTLPEDFNLRQCYFGEHLLSMYPYKTVAIAESEKTAVIASLLMPGYVWLAAGNLNGLTVEKSKVLRGRSVILFPDLGKKLPTRPIPFELWKGKAAEIIRAYGCKVIVSDLLERTATDEARESGLDVADYFIKQLCVRQKIMPQSPPNEAAAEAIHADEVDELAELETYFDSVDLPPDILKSECLSVCYPRLFVREAVKAIRNNDGNVGRLWEILFEMKDITRSGFVSIN